MISKIRQIRSCIDRKIGEQSQIKKSIEDMKKQIVKADQEIIEWEKAHVLIQTVSQQTQEQIKINLSDIVSMGMAAIFEDPYKLNIDFVPRRNRIEVDMKYERNNNLNDPARCGFGAKDVGALSLQFTAWALNQQTKHRTRGIIIMDEPLRWLKGSDYPERGAAFIKQISKQLGLQIIMTNHDPKLTEAADKVFKVAQNKNKQSVLKEV